MVFGLALLVGAITLVGNPPTSTNGLYNDIATFGFSFLILISVWMKYTKIMSVLPLENRRSISLNTLLLFTVSIEPFLFNLLISTPSSSSGDFPNVVSVAYAIDLGVMMLILGFFTSILADEQKKLLPKELLREFTYDAIGLYVSGGLFIASILIPLSVTGIGIGLEYDFWLLPFVTSSIRRRGERCGERNQETGISQNPCEINYFSVLLPCTSFFHFAKLKLESWNLFLPSVSLTNKFSCIFENFRKFVGGEFARSALVHVNYVSGSH